MRSFANWLLGLVLLVDLGVVALLVTSGSPQTRAQESPSNEVDASQATDGSDPDGLDGDTALEVPNRWTAEAIRTVGRELARRARKLEAREREIEELIHGAEVLRRAGIDPEAEAAAAKAAAEAAAAAAAQPDEAPAANAEETIDPAAQQAFDRLQKAFANMEPTVAAQALAELASRDKDAVVQMLLTWQPRTSGAILDAITQLDPKLSADLSYEIWRMRGKN